MRTLLVLPAVAVPLALIVLVVAVRRIGDSVRSLRAELAATATVGAEINALRADLDQLAERRSQRPRAPR